EPPLVARVREGGLPARPRRRGERPPESADAARPLSSRRAAATPASQPGARPPVGGRTGPPSSSVSTSSHETSEFEFHMSPHATSWRPHTYVGTRDTSSTM